MLSTASQIPVLWSRSGQTENSRAGSRHDRGHALRCRGGLEAGTKAAGLLTGGFEEEILLQASCFAVADNLQQLLLCLESGEAVTQRQTSMDNLVEFPSKRMAS